MKLTELFVGALTQVWYIFPMLVVVLLLSSRWFKGIFGEFLVNKLLLKLPASDYTLIKNVTLPTENGTTQIDHILVSKFGIFVIETKNMKGWIFGSKSQKKWTQKIYRHTTKFQNPLHQNYKHLKTLEYLLNTELANLHSVIVFTGNSRFQTDMPDNVTYPQGCVRYIKAFNQIVYSDVECARLISKLHDVKLKKGIMTDLKHRRHVKEIVKAKQVEKQCVRCGSDMVLRVTKRGENKGAQFWGCSTFPKCRSVEKLIEQKLN